MQKRLAAAATKSVDTLALYEHKLLCDSKFKADRPDEADTYKIPYSLHFPNHITIIEQRLGRGESLESIRDSVTAFRQACKKEKVEECQS